MYNQYNLSIQTKADIYSAWSNATPPSVVANKLHLALTTVIAEYIRLDTQGT